MLITFKEYLESLPNYSGFKNEMDDLKYIKTNKHDIVSQIEKDIELNNQTIKNKTFNNKSLKFLEKDNIVKNRLLEILKDGKEVERKEIISIIKVLERDKKTHQHYLDANSFSETTGSMEWHKTWIKVYDNWISYLFEKIKNT